MASGSSLAQQSIFGFTEGKFNAETVFLGNFTSLNKYILQQYSEEIKFTQGKDWLGFDILLLSNIYQGPHHSKE